MKGKVLSFSIKVSCLVLERIRKSRIWNLQVEMSRSNWKYLSAAQLKFKWLKMVGDQMRLWLWEHFGDYKESCKCELCICAAKLAIQMRTVITHVQLALNNCFMLTLKYSIFYASRIFWLIKSNVSSLNKAFSVIIYTYYRCSIKVVDLLINRREVYMVVEEKN